MFSSGRMWCLSRILVALAAFAGLCGLDLVSAAKPPAGGATHTSRIYYSQFTPAVNYQMYEDGSNKATVALPQGVVAMPSSKVYGGSRWWMTTGIASTGFVELFAYREGDPLPVQLTTSGGAISLGRVRWSNDGLDRFVTFHATGSLSRLWITDAKIAAIQAGGLKFTAADFEFVLPDSIGYFDYSWSNNDGMLAYLKFNYDDAGNNIISRTIWVRSLTTNGPIDVPIHTRTNAEGTIMSTGGGNHFQWSPDGSRIAFSTYNSSSSYGGVWTILPDGTLPVKIKTNSGVMSYTSRGWSPDGKELLLHTIKDRGFGTWYYNLAHMPAGGGTLNTLTSDLEQTKDKTAVGWVPL